MDHRAFTTRSRIFVRVSLLSIVGADEAYEIQLICFNFDAETRKWRENEHHVSQKLIAAAITTVWSGR